MHVCLVYDCLYPYTIGGAERWYRSLAEELAAAGHEVTFLTLRQWERDERADVPGVRVVTAGPRMALYAKGGRRRTLPPLRFGIGVFRHLLRHGREYDVVHTASFPYFSLLAVGMVRKRGRYRIIVDWHEAWTREYWRTYLGAAAGRIGWWVQTRCLRVPQRAFCFSRLHEGRLRDWGLRGELTRLEGQYVGPLEPPGPVAARPVVVLAGRLIAEKHAPALVPAVAVARERLPDLRCEIYGDGPDRGAVLGEIERLGLGDAITASGFVEAEVLDRALSTALCLVSPSSREGYGRIVIESSARGVPVVLVAGEDNAATELIDEGVNGTVAASASPEVLADAIVRVHEAGERLRESSAAWFRANAERLSLERSLAIVLEAYGAD